MRCVFLLDIALTLAALFVAMPFSYARETADSKDICEVITNRIANNSSQQIFTFTLGGSHTCKNPIAIRRSDVNLVLVNPNKDASLVSEEDHEHPLILVAGREEKWIENIQLHLHGLVLYGNDVTHECWGDTCGKGGAMFRNNGVSAKWVHNLHVRDVVVVGVASGGFVVSDSSQVFGYNIQCMSPKFDCVAFAGVTDFSLTHVASVSHGEGATFSSDWFTRRGRLVDISGENVRHILFVRTGGEFHISRMTVGEHVQEPVVLFRWDATMDDFEADAFKLDSCPHDIHITDVLLTRKQNVVTYVCDPETLTVTGVSILNKKSDSATL